MNTPRGAPDGEPSPSGFVPTPANLAWLERTLDAVDAVAYAQRIPLDGASYHSPGWGRMLGYDGSEPPRSGAFLDWLRDQTHPDDRADLQKAHEDFVAGVSPTYDVRIRLRHRSGDWIWVRGVSTALERGDDGRVTSLVGLMVDISRERRAQESLRAAEERVRRALQETRRAVFRQDADLRYTWMHNPGPRFSDDAMMGRTDAELMSAASADELETIKRRVLETGEAAHEEVRIRRGGEEVCWDIYVDPELENGRVVGVVTTALDTTELAVARDALVQAEEDVQAAERVKDAIIDRFALDLRLLADGSVESHRRGDRPDGRSTFLSILADHMRGRTGPLTSRWHAELEDHLGIRPQSVFPGAELLDSMPGVVRWVVDTVDGVPALDADNVEALRELAHHWRDGGYSVEETLAHFRLLGEVMAGGLEEALMDVGVGPEAIQAARAADQLRHALNLAELVLVATYRDAEEQRFSDFGSTLAHEVRGDLAAALGSVQLARALEKTEAPFPPEKREELYDRIEQALERSGELVASVEAVSRGDRSAPDTWSMEPLRDVVRDVASDADKARDGRVELVVGDLVDVEVPRDPVLLILHNLVANGMKYADPEKERPWVRIHAERTEDGHVLVHVGDNGLGIPEDEQARIFSRFRRGRQARGDGFGLGLAIAKQAATRMGAQLMLESEPGQGSTFSVKIPPPEPAHRG